MKEAKRLASRSLTSPSATSGHARRGWTLPILLGILGVAVVGSTFAVARSGSDYRFFDPLIDVRALIAQYAFEPPSDEDLQEAAIRGMLEALDDPYATYVPPEFNDDFNKALTGEYVGIGAEVNLKDEYLHIVTPLDGSPAFRAGILADDIVLEVDGVSTQGLPISESIDMLKGDPDTPVTLTVDRDGSPTDITVIRGEIKTKSVTGFHRDPTDEGRWQYEIDPERRIAYIRVSQFTPSVAREFLEAFDSIGSPEAMAQGIIIDVRSNPGGLMSEAISIVNMFLDEGVIVSTRGRAYPEEIANASFETTITDAPIVVLVNEQSASASEILAGALTENDRAIVLGTRTFGKGSVQSVRSLTGSNPGAVLKLTEQRYFLPSGRSLQRTDDSGIWGVDPSPGYYLPLTDEEAIELATARRQQEIIVESDMDDEGWNDPEIVVQKLADPQLAAALKALQARIDTGEWIQTGEANNPEIDEVSIDALADARLARERVLRSLNRVDRQIEVLETEVGEGAAADTSPPDFIPDDADIEGGTIVVRDANGHVLATLRIDNPQIERWLIDAGVTPLPEVIDSADTPEP
ncbi:MAG: S41 family peptidase [Planctomycetota bacterium]